MRSTRCGAMPPSASSRISQCMAMPGTSPCEPALIRTPASSSLRTERETASTPMSYSSSATWMVVIARAYGGASYGVPSGL
ncbi:hypothetical protein HNP84_005524 [Thermocatellispora tengchongensis]|uniref:Uncharacterized protein n=1 Tax=Thermocatellispora tengchongensis TaxID=1073253 RepID=A0A840PEA2_9ACTN|nr:hypothetical protein [Thermocatellispora tengchongensis]MBB5135780.1 hypothetical protein [Thermocatellispora tengchongensis]